MIPFIYMRTEKYSSTSLLFSMETFSPELISIDNRGAFFGKLADMLTLHSKYQCKKSHNFESLSIRSNECAYVVNFRQDELIFTNGFQDLLGYNNEKEITIHQIRQLYHPNDYEIITKVYKAFILYSMNYPEDSPNSTLFISFRIRKENGSYIKVLSKSTVLETDETGRFISSLVIFKDISFIDKTDNVNWDFKSKDLIKDFFKQEIYSGWKNFFTTREVEVIRKIEKRLTNKQIAQKLSISEHTVATHRKNIFKKAKSHHPEELIIFCKGKGII